MHRFLILIALAACTDEQLETTTTSDALGAVEQSTFVVPTGDGPNQLRVQRIARAGTRSHHAIVLMHGDFATFATNFTPMATWLAERGLDVWGIDRRWTMAPRFDPDLSDFDAMGLDQELDDIARSLAFIRDTRRGEGAGNGKVTLAGFSRGGQLAYFYASREATKPASQRHVKGLVPLDVYASLAASDSELRQFYCTSAADEYGFLGEGYSNIYNVFQLTIGIRAISFPDDPSPWDPTLTAREMMLSLVGETYLYFPATPLYHLNAPILDEEGRPAGLRYSSEDDVAQWLANAAPHQSMRESADTDQILCDATAFDVPLSRIRIPLLSIAAAGGYGERTRHSVAQTSSTDKLAYVIRTLPAAREAEDFGHADLLFAEDAPLRAWLPLLLWVYTH